jgi:hypothetical protein
MLVYFRIEKCNFEHGSYFLSCKPINSYLLIGIFLHFAIHISTFIESFFILKTGHYMVQDVYALTADINK